MKIILIIFCIAVIVSSCDKNAPAGFWMDFHKDLIFSKESDQGPWGGQREMAWKSEHKDTFSDIKLIEFARKNDWELVDSITLTTDTVSQSSWAKLKNDDYSIYLLREFIAKKLQTGRHQIFVFKTNWLEVEPGNSRDTFENGFAVINSEGTELIIFHLWGD